ncbi:MAG: beta-aspartyl-peptidase [Chloroflexi bacterium]|nr:beta-aspartyl-peptidase [Chloroflexota bacterium]
MRLELGTFPVREIAFGHRTHYADGVLQVNREELAARLGEDPNIVAVQLAIARPGESTRIIHVVDAVEPRVKVAGQGCAFPGFLGPAQTVGEGRSHRLAGVAVVATASLPGEIDSLSVKEAIVDMAGPGANISPFSQTLNLVLEFELAEGLLLPEKTASVRLAALKAAAYLGETVRQETPESVEVFELGPCPPDLPRIAYVSPLMHEGVLHNTFVYGVKTDSMPTLLHPNEALDGAIISADYHIAAYRSATYHHQNNPLIRELYRLHGRELCFVGMILCQTLIVSALEKERSASQVAKIARMLGAHGVLISMQNGGHGWADLLMTGQACERAGLKTVLVMAEMADADGRDPSMIMTVREADAIVSVGNMDELITLPGVERVLGGTEYLDAMNYEGALEASPSDEATTALRRLYCVNNQLGWGLVTASAY